jgi:hypothetical protein
MAVRAFNMLANGRGGIDWAGLPVVSAFLAVDDVEALIDDLETLVTHKPETKGGGG